MWAISIWSTVFAYNFLFLSPADGLGEKIPLTPYIEPLLKRGHQILHVTSKTYRGLKSENYSEILFDQMQFKPKDYGRIFHFY